MAPAVLEGITHVFYGFTRLFEALEHADLEQLRRDPSPMRGEVSGKPEERPR